MRLSKQSFVARVRSIKLTSLKEIKAVPKKIEAIKKPEKKPVKTTAYDRIPDHTKHSRVAGG